MSGSFEYGGENRWHDQYFAKELELTGTTAVTEALPVGKHHGSLKTAIGDIIGVKVIGSYNLPDGDEAAVK